jgi:hypothetical protein
MSLSSLIVQREVATMRQVEDALAHQVIYGGDLVTNLLEVAIVNEALLTPLLAESMKLPPAPPGELPRPSSAGRALVPAQMATDWLVAPLEVQGDRLLVAVAGRLSSEQEGQLARAAGRMRIEQRAAPAVRILQALAQAYGVRLDRRTDKLIARLSGSARVGTGTPSFGTAVPQVPRKSPPAAAVPHRVTSAGFPGVVPVSTIAAAPPTVDLPPATRPSGEGTRTGLLQRALSPGVRVTHRRRGPVTLDVALRTADEATDRDALLDLFFDFSRQFFEYAALFLVHGDIAEGRDAFGIGAAPAKVLGIGVPLDLPSILAKARDDRTPIVAKIAGDGLDVVLLADLQRARDVDVAVVPLVVRTRAVALLVGDCGESGVDPANVDQVAQFAGTIGKAFERLIVRRKLDGFVSGSRAGGAGRVAGSMVREKRPAAPSAAASDPPAMAAPAALAAPVGPATGSWRPEPLTVPPPTANIAVLRPISGPPIPREEPESPPQLVAAPAAPPSFHSETHAEEEHADGVFDEHAWEATPRSDPDPPSKSSAVAVPLHRPPHSHPQSDGKLPSVIVDLELEFGAMVDRVIAEQSDEAEGELLRQGERAMRVVMSRFPGPVTVERSRIATMDRPPRPSDCGPVLRLVVRERKVALPFVIERLEDGDPEVRGWATHVLGELPYVEAIPHLLRRLRDSDHATRASATYALAAIARPFPGDVREAVLGLAHSVDPLDRAAALYAASELRQPALVPELVHSLADGDESVVLAAHSALVVITRQDFGADARPWLRWWEQNAGRHRVEWLVDALAHEISEIRRSAAEELRAVSREYFGYSPDLPPRDRERAQQRYRDWWITEGRARFRRI